jgi:hypothetical protein
LTGFADVQNILSGSVFNIFTRQAHFREIGFPPFCGCVMKVGIGHLVLLEQPQTSIMSRHFRFQSLLEDLKVWVVNVSLGVPNS